MENGVVSKIAFCLCVCNFGTGKHKPVHVFRYFRECRAYVFHGEVDRYICLQFSRVLLLDEDRDRYMKKERKRGREARRRKMRRELRKEWMLQRQ